MRLDGKITHGMVMDVESVGADNISFVFGPVGSYIDPSIYYTKEEIDAMLANVGVQSDWNVTDTSSKAYIKHKPTIPAAPVQSDWNESDSTSLAYIKNKPGPTSQVQSDWSQNDSTAVDYIKNKPTIPDAQIQADWNQTTNTAKDYIKNKPTIPAAQVQSDWNEASTSSKAYIQNKPTIPSKTSDLTNDSCPIIEDTRSQATDVNITGTAPFATLAGGQRIVLHFKYANTASPTLQLTLSGGTTTSAYPLYQNYNNGVNALTLQAMPAGSYGEFVFDSTNSRWVLVGKDFNTTYSNTTQADINNSAQGSRLIEPKLLRDNFYLKSEVNNICPIIEDTRSSNVAAITGVAPFSTLVDKQRIYIHFNYDTANSSTLTLTLIDGTTTSAIPLKASYHNSGNYNVGAGLKCNAGSYMPFIYDATNSVWHSLGDIDYFSVPLSMNAAHIQAGTSTVGCVISPKQVHDNAYIVEETYSSGSLKANKMYDFGTVSSALTIPSLDATNDLVSNVLNFYALRFIAGADNLSITFPTGVIVDDTPTINTGDYVEIMINLYVVNSTNHFYASIKVWQAQ